MEVKEPPTTFWKDLEDRVVLGVPVCVCAWSCSMECMGGWVHTGCLVD